MLQKIRSITRSDLESLKRILDNTGLFPSEALEDMIEPYLDGRATTDIWFTYLQDDVPLALGYCIPEKLTDGTYNLLALAVDSSLQGSGIGSQMMRYLEQKLQKNGGRILIIDTSGDDDYRGTRQFYERLGYENVAVIKDFWKEGDDKVIYYKKLSSL